jgi:pimeloyl-ACP methyl ester carboxylesterase
MSLSTHVFRGIRLLSVLALVGLALSMPGRSTQAAEMSGRVSIPPPPASPHASCDPDRTQASGAIDRICMPPFFIPWNHDLVVFAHGYVSPTAPVAIPEDQLALPDGTSIPDAVTMMGYAFATTSYYTNGLAVQEGLADLVDLVSIFKAGHPDTNRVYLLGASEGGLITALAAEQHVDVFNGGAMALCGPVGDFRQQVNYFGDFRVVFDYFFPSLLPGSPITIPQSLMDNWDTYLAITITPALTNPVNAISVTQLLSVAQAAYEPLTPTTAITTISGLLWYNVFATNDAKAKLGGQPFDNYTRVYSGSLDDATLNTAAQRFTADPAAISAIQTHYQTVGQPRIPVATVHNTLDPIVPYWHEPLYQVKVEAQGAALMHYNLPVSRYGHCNFNAAEAQAALSWLVNFRFKVFLPVVLKQ